MSECEHGKTLELAGGQGHLICPACGLVSIDKGATWFDDTYYQAGDDHVNDS